MTSTTARHAPAATLACLRARQASTTVRTVGPVVTGTVTGAERGRLAATLGALLRDARRARGWSGRQLAARIGAAASTVHRLESGARRPRPVMLRHLADALTVRTADADALYAALLAAAGPSLAEDTPGGVRRRRRRALRVQQTRTATEWRRRRLVYEVWLRDQQTGFGSRRFEKDQAEHLAAFDAAITALDAAEAAGNTAAQLAALDRIRLLQDNDPVQGVLDRRDWWQTNIHRLLPDDLETP